MSDDWPPSAHQAGIQYGRKPEDELDCNGLPVCRTWRQAYDHWMSVTKHNPFARLCTRPYISDKDAFKSGFEVGRNAARNGGE